MSSEEKKKVEGRITFRTSKNTQYINDHYKPKHYIIFLTPIEISEINKIMPYRYKFELAESINSIDSKQINKYQKIKKIKNQNQNTSNKPEKLFNSYKPEKEQHPPQPFKSKKARSLNLKKIHTNRKNSHTVLSVQQICQYGIRRMKENEISSNFFLPPEKAKDAPCIVKIEKNIQNKIYENVYDFIRDLRKLWAFYIQNYKSNFEIFEQTTKMVQYTEDIIKEIEEQTEKGKNIKDVPIMERPMNLKDKENLANMMRALPKDQLKGLIKLLDEKDMETKNQYYEIDIETLSTEKLRKIEKYVKSCKKSSKNFIPLRYQEEFERQVNGRKKENKEPMKKDKSQKGE